MKGVVSCDEAGPNVIRRFAFPHVAAAGLVLSMDKGLLYSLFCPTRDKNKKDDKGWNVPSLVTLPCEK